MSDLLAEVSLCGLLHLTQDHSGDLLRGEGLLTLVCSSLDLDMGLRALLNDLEGVELDVILDSLVRPLSSNKPLGIEDGVLRVAGQLVLGGVPDESLALSGEGHVAGGDSVALVIGDDLNTAVFENSNT